MFKYFIIQVCLLFALSTLKNHRGSQKGKLKITPIRFKLLDVLDTQKPLRVKDIIKIVKSDIITVYRNLESLMKLGLVGQVFLDQKEAYLSLRTKTPPSRDL